MRTILLLSLLLAYGLNAVQAQRSCGTTSYQQNIFSLDPTAHSKFEAIERHSRKLSIGVLKEDGDHPESDTIITIPVVVHVLYNKDAQNISDQQIISQIEALNRDFNKLNPDVNQVPGPFTSLIANVKLRFELATIDPEGRATNGITRKKTGVSIFTDDDRIKFSSMGGDNVWDRRSYLNIWVGPLISTMLGYSSLPGVATDDKDGVVIRYDVFGTTGIVQPPFNMGRTLTHELGHWLSLVHLWGDLPCGDDGVDDTPKQRGYHTGCPSFPQTSEGCNTSSVGELFMDFMDFTDDPCMHMFTNGQKERMRTLFDDGGFRHDLLSSKALDKPWNSAPRMASSDTTSVLNVYPNPVMQQLTVRCTRNGISLVGKSFTIHNAMGQAVMTGKIQQETPVLNVGNLQAGLYFIKIANGSDKWITRFVKQ